MRLLLRKLVVWKLGLLARGVLWRYKPKVVAITGTVGKTTTRELTSAMLSSQFRVRSSRENYNSEFGVPLTILDRPVARSARQWLSVFWHGVRLIARRQDYPEILVLEMGAEKPGDLNYLTRLARPDIAVVTRIGRHPVHLEFYRNVSQLVEEKSWVVRRLPPDGVAVLNYDDDKVKKMRAYTTSPVLAYGFTDEASIYVTDIKTKVAKQLNQQAILHYRAQPGQTPKQWKLTTPLLGRHQLSAIMAAFGVAVTVGVDPAQALAAAKSVEAPPGRLRVLPGKGRLTILDDTYSSSPQAVLAALEVLYGFKPPFRAVLGDMKELGSGSVEGHRTVGEVAGKFLDELVVVGDEATHIAEAAKEAGMKPDRIHFASNAVEAAKLVNQDKRGGTVLIKASQSLYLERTVKALLKNPQDERYLHQRLKDPAHQVKAATGPRS
jgi:UDP-N-acetylmuramoyl-tripeptide--D-alanyl-D-alanine ligase